jgi:serine/threonine-protein kinase HipA
MFPPIRTDMARSDDSLEVRNDDGVVGELTRRPDRTLTFTYRDEWRARRAATPLSLSLPLAQSTHAGQLVANVLWGLLPDNDRVIDRWSRQFEVSPTDLFGLLRHVGSDVAGAMRFVAGDDSDKPQPDTPQSIADIERRIRSIRLDGTLWHPQDHGERWSLAGAQGKFALRHDPTSNTWSEPAGDRPTTHIFKPASAGMVDHDLNEHLCLAAAGGVGLEAASSCITQFGAERAIVVERYDRRWIDDRLVRIHQEDFCQALGLHPQRKYQSDGGSSPEDVATVLRRERPASAEANLFRFALALGFNWMIAGTDAHAKNYSVLLQGNSARLAPLYDLGSGLLLGVHVRKLKLAMKVGGEYSPHKISRSNFERLSASFRLDPTQLIDSLLVLASQIPEALSEAARSPEIAALKSPTPRLLTEAVADWCRACARTLHSRPK